MNSEIDRTQAFLEQLYASSEGDTAQQVSMYDVGSLLGLDKQEAGSIAEDLIVEGLAELVTLSGGIVITPSGLKRLNISVDSSDGKNYRLSSERCLTDADQDALNELFAALRMNSGGTSLSFEQIETVVLDLKTAEVQMLSPEPKTRILREILRSLEESVAEGGSVEMAGRIKGLLGD